MSDEARDLHRIISASTRDMLDAYRIQTQAGPVTGQALEEIILRSGRHSCRTSCACCWRPSSRPWLVR
ncbi:MAG: hypothetical protein HW376_1635 [candidate division NC10 bacterium]|nr:hypothetical protein [candidate division NC10 bacterium]